MDAKRIRHKLKVEQQAFFDDLKPEYIMPSLLEDKVLTLQEQQELKEIESRENQVEKLLDFMKKKGISDLKNFIKALRIDKDNCNPYPWLADILEKEDNLSIEVHKTLVYGDIPFPVNNLLSRDEKLNIIRDELKLAIKTENNPIKRHWVILHGPIGSGKTVLAAEAVRNNDVVENIFPGGVYWIYIGTLFDANTKDQKQEEIKKRMKTLFSLMNCTSEPYEDESMNNLKLCLKKEILKRKNMLVILDSVWSTDVINAFDIGCPILVTTNDKTVMKGVSGFCKFLDCPYDLGEFDIMNLIYKYVPIRPDEMKRVDLTLKDISNKCKGSPLIASLIGLRLADIGPELWSEFNKKLEEQGMGTVRRRRASGDYNHDIKTLVYYSLESINEYREYYQDFLIFAKDIPVPNEMLEILWGKSPSAVKDIMDELHHRCFVEKVKNENSKYPSYIPHDIYLDVLKDDIQDVEAWLKERHKYLIDQLHIQPFGDIDLTSLPKSYIPLTLCYHLSKAEEYDLLEKICYNLRFIEQKIHLNSGSESLYMDYHLYKPFFKNPKHVKVFEEFVRKNYVNIRKKADIIQLALFEPTDSTVYQKAKEMVVSQNFESYYDCCNKEESDFHFNCKIRNANEDRTINYAAFNSNGSLVATVGDTSAVVFSSTTGIELMELNGHSKEVLHCAFNSKGDQLATASEDSTVKIFKINEFEITSDSYAKKRLSLPFMDIHGFTKKDDSMFTFTQHKSAVVHCDFSPNDQHIISSDITKIIFVWECTSFDGNPVICQMVKHCSDYKSLKFSYFNHDGTIFGSCCNDTIQIWNVQDDNDQSKTITYPLPVFDFCFSRDQASMLVVINNDVFESDLESGNWKSILKYHSSAYVITKCCLSPDGNYFAYGTSSHSVIIINVHSHNIVAYFQGHNDVISNVMFSANGKKLLSVSSNRYIIHDIKFMKDKPLTNFAKNLSVRVNEDIFVASSNFFNCIEVRKGFDGKLIASSEISEEFDISACSLSYDCAEVVYGTVNGCLKVFNIDNKIINECLPSHENRITYILHSKNKPTFFTCSEDFTVCVWKDSFKTEPLVLRGHTQPVLMCAEFQTCNKLLSCSKDGTMKVWDTVSGDLLLPIDEGHGNEDVRYCDISQNGKLLASASSDETLKVWSSLHGQMKHNFYDETDQNASVKCCRFLPGKNILASGHDNGKVKLWSLLGMLPVEVLPESHDSAVHNILFQHGNRLKLLSLSNDIKLWHHRRLLQTIILPSTSMGFAPPDIWTFDDFSVIVVIVNYILYILKRI